MSKNGSLSVKFLKSMCLNNVHPKITAIKQKIDLFLSCRPYFNALLSLLKLLMWLLKK
jgi:hypothetical protein